MTSEKLRPATIDRLYDLLSESRRRYLLYLLSASGRQSVDELARRLVARERTGSTSAGSESKRQRVVTALVHNHLPRLAEHDVVDYHADRKTVEPGDAFDEIEPFLEHARSIERPPHRRSDSATTRTRTE